jgi:HlyD family secretion protein
VQAASPSSDSKTAAKSKDEIQGVFVLRDKKVEFVPVETGVAGTTDIEISKGIKDGDEIVTGSYKVLRTIKPGTGVKVDNTAPKKDEEST